MKTTMKKPKIITAGLLASLQILVGLLPFGSARAALIPGGAVGPVNPANGFPSWYRDQNGLTLDLMEAADPFGISAPVEPGNAFSQQIGFGPEGFWWSAEAAPADTVNTVTSTPVTGLLVTAMEAAFAAESAVDGEQSSFGRIRYRIDGLVPNTQYTVRHPFATVTETSDAVGVINVTNDLGCFATNGISTCDPAKVGTGNPPLVSVGDFSLALSSGIGPFLTWTTFGQNPTDPALINPVNPTRQYVGNPAIEHAVTGSPIDQNLFAVEGAGLVNFSTNLFAVTGRLALVGPTVTVDTQTAIVSTPTITGTVSDPTATVSVAVGGNAPVAATVAPAGTWSATLTTPLVNGTYDVVATGTNTFGSNTDSTTNELVINVGGAPVLTAITVTPATPTVTVGGTQQFAASPVDQFGAPIAATINWTSAAPATGTIDAATGLFTAIAAGQTTITATDGAINGSTTVTVNAAPPVTPPAGNVPSQPSTANNVNIAKNIARGALVTWTTTAPTETKLVVASKKTRLAGKALKKGPRKGKFNLVSTGIVTTNHSYQFVNLKRNKKVYFRIVTINANGSNSYSQTFSFKP